MLSSAEYSERELVSKGLCLSKLIVRDVKSGLYGRVLVTLSDRANRPLPSTTFGVRDIVQVLYCRLHCGLHWMHHDVT